MKQTEEQHFAGITYDPDEVQADALGGLPLMLADASWTP